MVKCHKRLTISIDDKDAEILIKICNRLSNKIDKLKNEYPAQHPLISGSLGLTITELDSVNNFLYKFFQSINQ